MPAVGDPMEHPPLRELWLSDKKPLDLKESAHYRGSQRRYAEFRFGAVGTTLVTVVLDRVSDRQTDVYVDRNRNRIIEDSERLAGPGPKYRVPLDVEILRDKLEPPKGTVPMNEIEHYPRRVVFRLGRSGRSISYATAGYMEGKLRLEGREIPVRRVDANGDGGMADPVDLVWLNWKCDGKWDPFTDRLPMTPIIQIEHHRYVVKSDWVGTWLALEKLEGSGELQLSLPAGKSKSDFMDLGLVLVGRDGSIAKLDLAQDHVEVPIGEYSPYELSAVVRDPAGGQPWSFFFNRDFDWAGIAASRGYTVKAKGHVAIAPLAGLRLDGKLGKDSLQCSPGEAIEVLPRVETGDHLMLRSCYRSAAAVSSARHPGAEAHLTTLSGKPLDSASSGFG